ncbi:disulfide bond formation protein B [Thauera linaloolentis]|uniref:Disulfide bond formation protein B n=1 Tax=Thauera linaloolentis (strain DSM 12138 / JCM 21573 / CCUG 41526 / CIP 105981 / IAM 15112 / NBRC 102519 / 47Lol) TaxID=1123367 RepID=N6Z8D7_THAL4|nr:disulfide bond formation protein B [Thauera linaloolentis]ENO90623.1 putative disulfide bond formation protein B [Thauera linaloolentis 47Lol = DSM 12138]MCM8566129.1 disulfide bond formation protein B [Thauera linaloolentis]
MPLIQTLQRLPARLLYLALFATAMGLLGFGLYLQHAKGLEPCPMCVMQRYAFLAVALIALVGGLHGPARTGSRIYAALIGLGALAGAGIAARQTWMQIDPPAIPECGPGLEFMLESFPLGEALPMIFRGAGDCAAVDWTFLGLSIANWSLMSFAATAVFALWMLVRRDAR